MTPTGYIFMSAVPLNTALLTAGTELFDSEAAMYTRAAEFLTVDPSEISGCAYNILDETTYSDDRGCEAPLNLWFIDLPMPSVEQFLNEFEM